MAKQIICATLVMLAWGALETRSDDHGEARAQRSVDVEFRFPKSADRDDMIANAKRFRTAFKDLKHDSLVLGDVRHVQTDVQGRPSVILSFTPKTPMHEMQSVVKLCRKFNFEIIDLTVGGEPTWNKFSPDAFDKIRFQKPTVLALMRDLCPGCKAKRDALWSDKELKTALKQRDIVLFSGNAATDKELSAQIRKTFGIGELPVVIVSSTSMDDKPIVLSGIPEPKAVIEALEKKVAVESKARE